MALSLNISVNTLTSGGFTFNETTGLYNGTNNPNGWTTTGVPNPNIADAVSAVLDIYIPDPITLMPVNTPVTINIFPFSFPTTDVTQSYLITPQDIGYASGEPAADGVYQFVYKVSAGKDPDFIDYTKTQYVLVYSAAQCCVSKLAVDAINDGGGCGCGSGCGESMTEFEKGMLLIEAAKYSIVCGLINPAANAIKHVNEICGGCSTC